MTAANGGRQEVPEPQLPMVGDATDRNSSPVPRRVDPRQPMVLGGLMIRVCDGTDPNLIGPPGMADENCACGATFNDERWMTIWPHREVHGALMIGRCVDGHHANPHRGCGK